MKKNLKFLSLLVTPLSLSPILLSSCNYQNVSTNIVNIENQATNSQKDIVPLDYFAQTPLLTQKTGPIISYGNKITSVDWYGSEIWSLDLTSKDNVQYLPGGKYDEANIVPYTKRVFINWALDTKNNKLWLLSNTFKNPNTNNVIAVQNVIEVDSLTGKVLSATPLNKYWPENAYRLFYQIQVLANGNLQIYSQGNTYWWMNILFNTKTKTHTFNNNKNTSWDNEIKNIIKKKTSQNITPDDVRMLYFVSVIENVNIAIFCDFPANDSNITNGTTGDLFLCLVDDNMNKIQITDTTSPWYEYIHIKNTSTSKTNNKDSHNFNKSIYNTLDGKIYWSAWEDFFVFFPEFKSGYGITFKQYDFESGKRVQSYTMDVNENVFIKFWDDTKVYKMTITGKRPEDTNFSVQTYYDIGSSNDEYISKNANNFVLYNVTGYTGSIMMLSSRILTSGSDINNNPPTEEQLYGVAASVVPNKNQEGSGDTLGLLNTDKSFLKSSDFEISTNILKTKIPSEITRNDITLLNGGFFTSNTAKDDNNNLKYPPFSITNIDDKSGTFTVTANIDQIPWFASTLPSDAIPKTIVKEYKNGTIAQKIDTKISWKDQNSLSYDFKNTLPSKISVDDLNDFDPFQVSFNSRTVLSSSGEVLYPKKTYSVASHDDTQGTVNVKVVYDYMPASSEVDTPLKYETIHQYTVFKSGDTKAFYFAGATNAASGTTNADINIQSVPQLKSLSESNLLPSSFSADNKNAFLQFINTNKSTGYPISKMNFGVTPNDTEGTLVVTATVDRSYDSAGTTFVQKFTGFNKKQNYSFKFKPEVTTISNKQFSEMLASSVNEGDVIDSLIEYQGFNSSDFEIKLNADDDNGSLYVQVNLNKDYVSELGNSNGFSNYTASYQFNGFMTSNDYNNQYNIEFVSDSDKVLGELKKLTLDNIKSKLDSSSLEIGGKTYTNLNDLIENLFIKSKGTKIPSSWKDKTGTNQITSTMSIDNQAGTMNLSIVIDSSLLEGYGSNLNYVISYSGFAKGNAVVTEDNLSFVSQDQLFNEVPELEGMTPSQMKIWLEQEGNLNKILFNVTGQYELLLQLSQYNLLIDANDAYGTITITIKFIGVSNKDSLSEYSIQYNLLNN